MLELLATPRAKDDKLPVSQGQSRLPMTSSTSHNEVHITPPHLLLAQILLLDHLELLLFLALVFPLSTDGKQQGHNKQGAQSNAALNGY
jgi:hypothetical protein